MRNLPRRGSGFDGNQYNSPNGHNQYNYQDRNNRYYPNFSRHNYEPRHCYYGYNIGGNMHRPPPRYHRFYQETTNRRNLNQPRTRFFQDRINGSNQEQNEAILIVNVFMNLNPRVFNRHIR
ncbi:unnamed protein product [Rotaria sp. Silwood1]|nr:unnamed protein product [Rotaria sp. Silwood1]CAF1690330.1 unnamed protein product [Rotaria sp. Silwood1]CAF3924211.1 unnamed protein product [Rotaria sp. Silwood1]CAF4881138.1 unnamed protein product [Rotaria sp. Silwood1]